MKRVLLLSLALLLTLMLLPTTPIAAVGPPPKGEAEVKFNGPDITSGLLTGLDVYIHKLVVVSGPAGLTFEGTPGEEGLWYVDETLDFTGRHEGKLGIRIDKWTGETEIFYSFGVKLFEEKKWPAHQLTGSGEWPGVSIPYGTITVNGEAFTIYEMFYERKGKGAIGVTYKEVWSGYLSFDISITAP